MGSLQSLDWNGGITNSAKIRSKGHNIDADNEFNGDECANLKWPIGCCHCRKHPHFCIVNSTFYVATQSIVILCQ